MATKKTETEPESVTEIEAKIKALQKQKRDRKKADAAAAQQAFLDHVHDLGEWIAEVAKVTTAEEVLRLRGVLDSDEVRPYIEKSMKPEKSTADAHGNSEAEVEKSTTPEAAGAVSAGHVSDTKGYVPAAFGGRGA